MYAFESLGHDWEVRLLGDTLQLTNEFGIGAQAPYQGDWEQSLRWACETLAKALFNEAYHPARIEVGEIYPLQQAEDLKSDEHQE